MSYNEDIEFTCGVASGDPLQTQVIIWTHAKYINNNNDVFVKYEVSLDINFTNIVKSDIVITTQNTDFTLKVDVTGLEPDTIYYYRFININNNTNISPIGRTRTIPSLEIQYNESITFAVVSCSHYASGYFNVYKEIGKLDNLNAIIHLGDYIYEYGNSDYGTPFSPLRSSNPDHVCYTLDDFRKRYSQYKSDIDSQYMHSRHPMIPIWDDHEVADNSWKSGTEIGESGIEYITKKNNAIRAYHEYMPIRTGTDNNIIFRTFDFGDILSLHMLDTRHYERDKQITHEQLLTDPLQYKEILYSPTRKLLGPLQLNWLNEQMAKSKSHWQVLGNQVIMSKIQIPVSILINLNNEFLTKSITDYLTALNTPLDYRTTEQNLLLDTNINPVYGTNLDGWDGYPAERERLYTMIKNMNKNLIVLSGDSHNSWSNNLRDNSNNLIGNEFAVTSVSSIGLEATFPNIPPSQIQLLFTTLFPDVKWIDTYRRGYLIANFTKNNVNANWKFIDNVNSKIYNESLPSHEEIINYIEFPVSDICFPATTPILTNKGNINIEQINPDIHTIRNRKIIAITKTITQDKYLICFEKDSLGINIPSQKTIISKNHLIFYKGKMIKAKKFLYFSENVKKIKYNGEVLYNVLLETHDKMMVNNMICETLHPDNVIAQLYRSLPNLNKEEQQELIKQTNKWIKYNTNSPSKIIPTLNCKI